MGIEDVGRVADQCLDTEISGGAIGAFVEGLAHAGGEVDLEVASVQDPPGRRLDQQRRSLGQRMRDRQELHAKRPRLDRFLRLGGADGVVGLPALDHLLLSNAGGEVARVHRGLQPVPKLAERGDVILVGVGDEDRLQPVAAFGKPGHVGQDQIDAGRTVHVGEGNAQIDQDQPFLALRPVAVDIGVHSHFARPAEGQIDQSLGRHACSLL